MRLNFEEKIILLSHFDFILIILSKLRKVKNKEKKFEGSIPWQRD